MRMTQTNLRTVGQFYFIKITLETGAINFALVQLIKMNLYTDGTMVCTCKILGSDEFIFLKSEHLYIGEYNDTK